MNLEIQIQFEDDPINPETVSCQTIEELEKIINRLFNSSKFCEENSTHELPCKMCKVMNVKITDMS